MVKRWINGKVKFMILFFVCGISTYSNSLTDEQKKSIHEEVIKYLESNKIKLGKGKGLAIGEKSFAEDDGDMVIGKSARSRGNGLSYSIAIGYNAFTLGSETKKGIGGQATAIGAYTFASSYALALGYGSNAYGDSSVALGGANISGQDSYGIGGRNHNSGDFSTSIGYNSMTTTDRSIVMGDDTVSHYGKDLKDGFVDDKTYKKEYDEMFDKIMAEEGEKIKKKYKDAGYTDEQIEKMYIGIEIGQLATRELSKKYTKYNENGSGSGYFKKAERAGANVVIGSNSKAFGSFNTVLGAFSEVYGEYNIALGVASKIKNSLYSMAIGDFSKVVNSSKGVALGCGASVTKEGAIALGSDSVANREGKIQGYSVINKLNDFNDVLNLINKKEEYDKNFKIISSKEKEYNELIDKITNAKDESKKQEAKNNIDEWVKKNEDFVKASKANAQIMNLARVWESGTGAISVGYEKNTRQIINLAAGTRDSDAVNVAQLKQLKTYVDSTNPFEYAAKSDTSIKLYKKNGKYYKLSDNTEYTNKDDVMVRAKDNLQVGNIQSSMKDATNSNNTRPNNPTKPNNTNDDNSNVVTVKDLNDVNTSVNTNKTAIADLTTKITDITTNITNVNNRIEKIDKKVDKVIEKSNLALGGVSNAIAMANLPQVMGDNKFNLSASYGYYGSTHALAIGFSGTNEKQNFVYKLSGAVNSKGNLAFGAGFGIMIGKIKEVSNEKVSKLEKEFREYRNNSEKQLKEYKEKLDRLEKLLK